MTVWMDLEGITLDISQTGKINIVCSGLYGESKQTNKKKKKKTNFLEKDLKLAEAGREKAMAPHSSTPAWKIPWTEEPGRLQSMGSLRVGHD